MWIFLFWSTVIDLELGRGGGGEVCEGFQSTYGTFQWRGARKTSEIPIKLESASRSNKNSKYIKRMSYEKGASRWNGVCP